MMSDLQYWQHRWSETPAEPPNNFAKRAYKLMQQRSLKALLDLGCGNGRDAVYFHEKGLTVTAIDISESGIAKLRVREPGITTIKQSIEHIEFPKNAFDVIYAHLSLQYFDDKTTTAIFQKLYRLLKNGGLLFVTCKSIDDPLYGKGRKIGENMFFFKHVRHFFSKEYMAEQLKEFKVISLRKTTGVYHDSKSRFIEAVATK